MLLGELIMTDKFNFDETLKAIQAGRAIGGKDGVLSSFVFPFRFYFLSGSGSCSLFMVLFQAYNPESRQVRVSMSYVRIRKAA